MWAFGALIKRVRLRLLQAHARKRSSQTSRNIKATDLAI
jgi:hypothetical protein